MENETIINPPPSIEIQAGYTDCINYASWQNSVPILRFIRITNKGSESFFNLRVELTSSPTFTKPKTWLIDRLNANSEMEIQDNQVELDGEYLLKLNEAEKSIIKIEVISDNKVMSSEAREIRILSRDEWGGFHAMAELLAAFVMPNDPVIPEILKSSSRILAEAGFDKSLEGYQRKDRNRTFLFGSAIWSAISLYNLTYANPPASFERRGQKVRIPSTVIKEGLATCLDLTLLFASVLEAIGLRPVIILLDDHAYCGYWLIEHALESLIEINCSEIRKSIANGELITFETTLITKNPAPDFDECRRLAELRTKDNEEHKFVCAVDIHRARSAQILPISANEKGANVSNTSKSEICPVPLPKLPDKLPQYISESEQKPQNPKDRIDRWQSKLLDLTLRNRLVNFKQTKQVVPLLSHDVSQLEDRLNEEQLKIKSKEEHLPTIERDKNIHLQKTGEEVETALARSLLEKNEILSELSKHELEKRLTEIYRKAQNDLAEGGANTLHLAIGFLKWKKLDSSKLFYQAPLILVPIKLNRTSKLSKFSIELFDDEIRFNSTLIQLLKREFNCDISALEKDLPLDEKGIDIPKILQIIRSKIRDIPGFEVLEQLAISTFSFAKYLMWKDLVDRTKELEKNRVVKHLIHDPDKPFKPATKKDIPDCYQVDQKYSPKDLHHPLHADSSQLAAMIAAGEGHDFVLIGPPGTGKSQTIANIISHTLAKKKTVLFVAEKTAALDVVYRRLKKEGLSNLCLELHSKKAEKKRFFEQLKFAWESNQKRNTDNWLATNKSLLVKRNELNGYVKALHINHPNGWNAYRAIGLFIKHKSEYSPQFDWEVSEIKQEGHYANKKSKISLLTAAFHQTKNIPELNFITHKSWSLQWESELFNTIQTLELHQNILLESFDKYLKLLGFNDSVSSSVKLFELLEKLSASIKVLDNIDISLIFNPDFNKLIKIYEELGKFIKKYRDIENGIEANYDPDSIPRIPVDDLENQWRNAVTSYWPFSYFAKNKVKQLLKTYTIAGKPDPQNDIRSLRQLQKLLTEIDAKKHIVSPQAWDGISTDLDRAMIEYKKLLAFKNAIVELGNYTNGIKILSQSFNYASKNPAFKDSLFNTAAQYIKSAEQFFNSVNNFKKIAGKYPFKKESSAIFEELTLNLNALKNNRSSLRNYVSWNSAKFEAIAAGLELLVDDLIANKFNSNKAELVFDVGYVRWWLPKIIDETYELRTFRNYVQELSLTHFREFDDSARKSASTHIRNIVQEPLPKPHEVARSSELGFLNHQIGLKRPSKTIRESIQSMGEYLTKLTPCLLMSPISVAQFLPAVQTLFDIVIFDEASQITTWDAIGAIARGKQTIIVGDPKQLPPTNFFKKSEDENDEDIPDEHRDLESILDEMKSSGIPTLNLNWHYRSRYESLIAFSNKNYYDNKLITFPAAETKDYAVSIKHLPEAIYDRGSTRTNQYEADVLVNDAVDKLKSWFMLPEEVRPTLGVITFNIQQQELIQNMFDTKRSEFPEIEWFFDESRNEPVIVKNLENVQGDERDYMFFSICFGPDSNGRANNEVGMNFGALNKDGGEKRLNVAITRAREQLIVYSSFKADQLKAERAKNRGVKYLKAFLEYAERGSKNINTADINNVVEHEFDFENTVAEALRLKGWNVKLHVGVSAFKVDLGIISPDNPDKFLAAILTDGHFYNLSATARDREIVKEQILKNMGWFIIRVWSLDWMFDLEESLKKLDEKLGDLLPKENNVV